MGILEHSRRKLTYDDYLRIPEDGLRHEIVDGEEAVTPSPGWNHQRLQQGLAVQLDALLERTGRARVVTAPMDVRLSDTDIVQPDILAVAPHGTARVSSASIIGPPDLVIEVLSASTRARDRGGKLAAYDRAGVPEVWLIDPEGRCAERWARRSGGPLRSEGSFDARIESRAFPGAEVDLVELWRRLE